MPLLAAW
jgi:hypothetical protein